MLQDKKKQKGSLGLWNFGAMFLLEMMVVNGVKGDGTFDA